MGGGLPLQALKIKKSSLKDILITVE